MNVGNCAAVCGPVADDKIIAKAYADDELVMDDDDASEDDEAPVMPSLSTIMEGLGPAPLLFSFKMGNQASFNDKKQRTITDLFCDDPWVFCNSHVRPAFLSILRLQRLHVTCRKIKIQLLRSTRGCE